MNRSPIGVFDSGYGGLTILKEIVNRLPGYDFIYAGDNARTPYGTRSFETVHQYTLQAVKWMFSQGCRLVVIACNTASAKALRTIQQKDLPLIAPDRRVLGVIRPVTEIAGNFTATKHIGLFATPGTVKSDSYTIELKKFFPDVSIVQEACTMWVPLIENNEFDCDGADYFFKKHTENLLCKDSRIDAIILGCTHYPIIEEKIKKFLPGHIKLISQGSIVAESLASYLVRHTEMNANVSKTGSIEFFTSENTDGFDRLATLFYGKEIRSSQVIFG